MASNIRKKKSQKKYPKKSQKKSQRIRRRTRKITPSQPSTIVIGKIYSHGCGYCIQLAPIWNTMEKELNTHHSHIIIKNIEQANEELEIPEINNTYLQNAPNKLQLQGGYPTIFKIVNGQVSYYNSERTVPALMKWAIEEK
jgi:thiol-disulfide isomerase/thioredoxin